MKVVRIAQVAYEPVVSPSFTGPVTTQPIIGTEMSNNIRIVQVNFGRGVRNKLHSHTVEQILIVTEGKGVVATETKELPVGPGDVIFFPAGEKHWHGAAEGATFSHIYVMPQHDKTVKAKN